MAIKIDETVVKDVFQQTQEIIDACPERLAGSPLCKKGAEMVAERLKKHCDSTTIEDFEFHPYAFIGFFKIESLLYIPTAVFFFLGYLWGGFWVWLAAIGFTFINFNAISQFVFYWTTFDPLYKKATGYNVEGKIEPPKEVKQQIIIAGHHDSANIFTFLAKFQKWYAPRIIGGIVTNVVAMVLAWLWLILEGILDQPPFFAPAMPYLLIIGFFLAGDLYFFAGKKGVPGAGDNLVASVIAIKLAEIFSQAKKNGTPLVEHTRLIFSSADAEESGLRGSKAYVKKHKQELLAVPTYMLNIDSVFDINEIHFLTTDVNNFQKLSKAMAEECVQIAKNLGIKAVPQIMTFGGGATDASEYAKIGVESTTLIAIGMEFIRDGMIYHTPEDKVENLDPKTSEAALKIAYEYILKKDRELQK